MGDKYIDYRHIWLYAKYHYVRGDLLEDLKIILAERSGIEPKAITTDHVIRTLVEIILEHVPNTRSLQRFIGDIISSLTAEESQYLLYGFQNYHKRLSFVVNLCLSQLAIVSTCNSKGKVVLNLGEADSSIAKKIAECEKVS